MVRVSHQLFGVLALIAIPIAFVTSTAIPGSYQAYKTINFTYPNLYPESFTYDPPSGNFILGSLTTNNIISVTKTGVAKRLFQNPTIDGTLGLYEDVNRNLHTAVFKNNAFIGYVRYDFKQPTNTGVNTGVLVQLNTLFAYPGGPRGHGVNDVGTDSQGNAYLSDTFGNIVVKIDKLLNVTVLASGAQTFNTSSLQPLSAFSADYSVNGIKFVPSCGVVLTGTLGKGQLFTITPSGTVRTVTTGKQVSVDGLNLVDDFTAVTVSAVGGSKATYWTTKDCWKTASVTKIVDLSKAGFNGTDPGITAVVIVKGIPWVLGAYINEYNAAPGKGSRSEYQLFVLPAA